MFNVTKMYLILCFQIIFKYQKNISKNFNNTVIPFSNKYTLKYGFRCSFFVLHLFSLISCFDLFKDKAKNFRFFVTYVLTEYRFDMKITL